jgi:AraC-like DNA-binding protein/quercetin dioxygenase-like cupin family protein
MLHLRWRATPGEYGHLIRVSCERGSPLGLHTHNFPEIFWLEAGPCLHRINGEEQVLQTGALVFIRARDEHQFAAIGRRRFIMINLECHPAKIEELKRRHPKPFQDWMNARPRLPWKVQLSNDRLQHLQQMALSFANDIPDALHFEAFLLNLARLVEPSRPNLSGFSHAPDWLQKALLAAQKHDALPAGVAGLVATAGRSPEHVARVCKATLKKTPTALMEEFRMTYAERELRLSAGSVTDIALSCGYSTTAQFYRAFRKRYSRTPLRYRRWIAGAERH